LRFATSSVDVALSKIRAYMAWNYTLKSSRDLKMVWQVVEQTVKIHKRQGCGDIRLMFEEFNRLMPSS
jgi:hypothetical protein